jgi:hypothetical protein
MAASNRINYICEFTMSGRGGVNYVVRTRTRILPESWFIVRTEPSVGPSTLSKTLSPEKTANYLPIPGGVNGDGLPDGSNGILRPAPDFDYVNISPPVIPAFFHRSRLLVCGVHVMECEISA